MPAKLLRILVAATLTGVLLASLAAVSLADETANPPAPPPDPVVSLGDYLTGLNADPAVIDSVRTTMAAALSDPEGSEGAQALLQAMLREEASLEVVLRVTDRLHLMMDGDTNFGQVMKVFRLSLKEGRNAGIDRALENAERKVKGKSDPAASESPKQEKQSGENQGSGRDGAKGGGKGK